MTLTPGNYVVTSWHPLTIRPKGIDMAFTRGDFDASQDAELCVLGSVAADDGRAVIAASIRSYKGGAPKLSLTREGQGARGPWTGAIGRVSLTEAYALSNLLASVDWAGLEAAYGAAPLAAPPVRHAAPILRPALAAQAAVDRAHAGSLPVKLSAPPAPPIVRRPPVIKR